MLLGMFKLIHSLMLLKALFLKCLKTLLSRI